MSQDATLAETAISPEHAQPQLRPELFASVLVFIVGLLVTYSLWQNAQRQHMQELQGAFDSGTREAELKIEQRLSNYQNVLRGLQALFESSKEVERAEFTAYTAALRLDENYPGTQSLGYTTIVPEEQRERHIAAIRKEGFSDYRIKPEGNRKLYAPVIYVEPFRGRNQRVFGLDNYATPERRTALEHARDSGQACISGKLTLVQDDSSAQSGILMFLPIYRNGMPHDTPTARRASITGWVSAAFRMNSLIAGLLDTHTRDFDIEIYDGPDITPGSLLYDSNTMNEAKESAAIFRHIRHIAVADRAWTVSFASTPAFESRLVDRQDIILSAIGCIASLVLALCTGLLLCSRKRALHDAWLLQDAMRQAEMASRAKSEFLANIGHELRTPMNAILGMTHLALEEETKSRNRRRLENIQFSGEHLLHTIDNILDYSGMEYQTAYAQPTDFSLRDMLDDIESVTAPKAAAKGIELAIDIAPGLARRKLHGDAKRMEQVLLNYLDNAIKFTSHGNIVLRVMTQAEDDASFKLRFEVQDSGIGIDTEKQRHLFSPFWQADSSSTREHEGIGLGLAICKKLIEMMKDGEFGVNSTPGSGSTFWFSVRLNKAQAIHRNEQEPAATTGSYTHIKGAQILVAEDNVLSQTIIGGLLESAGAEVHRARNGSEALQLLQQKTFDCVLMDVQMPEMDGIAATRAIRANPALAKLPVIAVTAHASKENRQHCLEAGMNDFIGKPFTPASLYTRLAHWLPPRHSPDDSPPAPQAIAETVPEIHTPRSKDSEIIDLSTLSELIGGDREKMRDFANKFVEMARGDMAQIETALEHNDRETLSRLAHHHKAPARMVGAQGFADLCQELSDLSKQAATPTKIRKAVSRMRPLLDRIEQRVRQELAY